MTSALFTPTNLKLIRRFLRGLKDSQLFATRDLGLEVFALSPDGRSWRHALYLHNGGAGIKWYEDHKLVGQWVAGWDGEVRPVATSPKTPPPNWLSLPDRKGSRAYRVAYYDSLNELRGGGPQWEAEIAAQSPDEAALIVIATYAVKYRPYHRWGEGYWMDTINHTTRVEVAQS